MARRKQTKQRTLSKIERIARDAELDDERREELERERRLAVLFSSIRLNTIPACLGAARVPDYYGSAIAELWLLHLVADLHSGTGD